MQIISGKFRGKKLEWRSNATTRPTTSRVKENIFNILVNIRGNTSFKDAQVLCLFSGCGQMGLECFSRGAADIVFNDADTEAVAIIKKNCTSVGCRAKVFNLDFSSCLKNLRNQEFDIVFLDPPYAAVNALPEITAFLRLNNMLRENGVIVIETEHELTFENYNVKQKKYGRAKIYFLQLENNA